MSVLHTNSTPIDDSASVPFVDRRQRANGNQPGSERRQFGNSYANLTADGQELAEAIDRYKVQHRRRYITTDELLGVLQTLGYKRS